MAQPQPFTVRKTIIGVLMVGWLVLLLWGLERKYDESDYRKTDQLLAAPGAAWSLEKELISSFRGLVRLTCAASGVEPWRFEVDLVRRSFRGLDPRSEEVVAAVERRRRPPDAGGQPPDSGDR